MKITTWLMAFTTIALLKGSAYAQPSWPVRFADGTTVELLAIATNPVGDDGATGWWAPDGAVAADPQFRGSGSFSGGGMPGTRPLQLILQTSGPPMTGKNLVVRVEPDFSQGLFKMRDARGEMLQVFAPAPPDKPTFNVRFGLASGAAADSVLWQRPGGDGAAAATQPADDAPVQVLGISEQDGQTLVQIQMDRPAPARRRQASSSTGTSGGGGNSGNNTTRIAGGGGGPTGGNSGGGGTGGRMRGGGGPGGAGGPGGPGGAMGGPGGGMLGDILFHGSPNDQSIAVIVRRNQKLAPVGFEGAADGSTTLRFRCAMPEVEKIILASRAYEWLEMQNISAQPAEKPTKVSVVPVKEPATPTTRAADVRK